MVTADDWKVVCPDSRWQPEKPPLCRSATQDLFSANAPATSFDTPEVAVILFRYLRDAGAEMATARDMALWIAESSAARADRKRLREKLGELVDEADGAFGGLGGIGAARVESGGLPTFGSDGKRGAASLRPRGLVIGTPSVDGGLLETQVSDVVTRHTRAISACFEKEQLRNPGLHRDVVVAWKVDVEGRATAPEVQTSSIALAAVEGCLRRQVRAWRFPQPLGENRGVNLRVSLRLR
jgi:hypothetical protein